MIRTTRHAQRQAPVAEDTPIGISIALVTNLAFAIAPSSSLGFDGLVAIARGKTPDPIPNSAVKTLSANGTAS